MKLQSQLLLNEIDQKCATASPQRISQIAQALLTQYFSQAAFCADPQLDLYDQAVLALVTRLNAEAMADISRRLAEAGHNPPATICFLANQADIDIAGPVLRYAELPDDLIASIAGSTKGTHLLALASRATLKSETVDALLASEIPAVIGQTVKNQGAVLSEVAFSALIGHAAKDKNLARLISLRSDVPEELRAFVDMILQ